MKTLNPKLAEQLRSLADELDRTLHCQKEDLKGLSEKGHFDVWVPVWENEWHGELASCCGHSKSQAWDAAIRMYDEGVAPDGYPFSKDKKAKVAFLRRSGVRIRRAAILLKD